MGLDRRIKLIATVGALASFVALGIGWIVVPSNDLYVAGTLASLLAAGVYAITWRVDAIPSVTIVIATLAITLPVSRLIDEEPARIMSTVGVVVVSTLGVVLVRTHRPWYVGTMTAVIVIHPLVMGQPLARVGYVGVPAAISFLLGTFVLISVANETHRLDAERLDLLNMAPAFISEDDWTEAERRVRELGIDDPDELRRYLMERRDLVVDIVGTVHVVHSNPKLLATFGSSADGSRFSPDRVHDDSIGAFVEQIISIITDKPLHDYEYRTTTKEGKEITLSLRSIVNRRHPGQTRVLLVAQDITDQRQSRLSLERAIRMKDEFVAGVSHELRTPLAGVVGLTATVLESNELTAENRELLEIVADQAHEMARIIEDLLVASRAHEQQLTVELGPVDACAEVRNVASGRDMTVKADGSVMVKADPGRLRQIVRNLATNAARYGEPPVEIAVIPEAHRVKIEVSDHGPPIPSGLQERIFEPFQSALDATDRPAGSVGLGLAVSRMLARRMGGDLTYRHDGRSVFCVELSAHQEMEAAE
ncbi:MAG: ATP-binding protein [Acidimicrobiia bacterium]